MPGRNLLILTALELEARAVSAAFDGRARGTRIEFRTIGMRANRLHDCNAALDAAEKPNAILLAGLGGALDPTLAVGDVIVEADSVVRLPTDLPCRRGTVHTAEAVIATTAAKARCFADTGASVVDMENRMVRQWANARNVPFIGIRAVSDTANRDLPPQIETWIDDLGRPRPLPIAISLLRRPWLLPTLLRVGRDTKTALRSLGDVTKRVVDCLSYAP